MHRITQESFILMLMKGEFYQGYIEGIGIVYADTITVPSTTSPLPYNPLVPRDTIWYHRIERLAIRPLKVIAPTMKTVSSQEMMEFYKKTYRPNFSDDLKKWVERLEREARLEVESRNKAIVKLEQEIADMETATDEKTVRKRDGEIRNKRDDIARLEQKKQEYVEVLNEINTMALSDQRYDVTIDNSYSTSTTNQGMLTVDVATKKIIVSLPQGASLGFFAHEFKHAYQFETGRLSLRRASDGRIGGATLYDKYDEMEAFNRGALFREGSRIKNTNQLPSAYSKISNNDLNMNNYNWSDGGTGPLTHQRLQRIATRTNNIIRYNGVTYFPQR